MPANKSIGIVKQMRPPHGLCKNEDVLQGFTECIGSCHSSTYFNPSKFYILIIHVQHFCKIDDDIFLFQKTFYCLKFL